ncbi:50S ribosomal protein L11 methyltransferase [Saccharolobus solfataricus]|uniref:50S ribosomal protein L11 methyltransferase n=1 Tax=Saccharolobus solfataricus TaxID=2287 RepID=UPI0001A774AF|nr:50S ribosomal protein L11 methyltransferase [Saccharolobus solfataricus]
MEIIPPKRMIELIREYSAAFKNWPSVMLAIYLHKDKIKCILRNGQIVYLTPKEAVLLAGLKITRLDDSAVKFFFNNIEITLKGWKLSYPGDSFSDYWRINVRGKRVLDIGAGIGDSPIYFSLAGAKEVVAVEIDKRKIELMKENLTYNGITNVIIVDKGVGVKDDENVISWENLVKDYGPFDVAKIDCDGCEKEITPFIKEIPELLIEWDNEYIRKLSIICLKMGTK